MVKIFQNWSQYGVTILTNFFQNFEVDTKIPKSPKLAQITKILKKILKTNHLDALQIQAVHPPPRVLRQAQNGLFEDADEHEFVVAHFRVGLATQRRLA